MDERAGRPIRLVLADDHPIVLHGLEQLFEGNPGFEVVACCGSGEEALAAVRPPAEIDVLVADVRMPRGDGLEVLRSVMRESLACRVVLLTAALRDADAAEIMRLGAMGLVLKESPADALVDCVQHVARGARWIDRAVLTRAFERATDLDGRGKSLRDDLTPRELEIVRMVGRGLRNREISAQLSISEGTVKIHLHNVYEKLGVGGRLELLLYAQDRHWI